MPFFGDTNNLKSNVNSFSKTDKSEGKSFDSVISSSGSQKGYSLNVEGKNIVIGLGTSQPFSKLSLGNNSSSGLYNANDIGQMAKIALNETETGGKFTGLFYKSQIPRYNQLNDSSGNGIQILTTESNTFDTEDTTESITLRLNKTLESMIKKKPEEWIWTHNRWK